MKIMDAGFSGFFWRFPGSPVLFPRWAFPELLRLPEGKGGGWVIKEHPECVEAFPVDDPYQLMDADTPETLAILQTLASP